jgi:hypothetical protein
MTDLLDSSKGCLADPCCVDPVSTGRGHTILSLALLLLLAACGEPVPERTEAVVRDSGGVRIVENVDPVWGEGEVWRVAPEPSVVIGEADGPEPYQLFRVRGVLRLDDGGIAVANAGTSEIKIFDASGAHRVTIGREGEGPGEFRYVDKLLPWSGDSLAVSDGPLRRISVYSSEGVLGRTILLANVGGWPIPRGLLSDGSIVLEPNTGPVGQMENYVFESNKQPILRLDPVTERYDTIALTLSERWVGGWRVRGQRVAIPMPYSGAPYMAAGPGGVYHGYSSDYQIEYWTSGGGLQMIIRRDVEPTPVSDRHIALAWDTVTGIGRLRGGLVRRNRADVVFNETLPVFGPLLVDDLGHLWVTEFTLPGDSTMFWSVFDTDGFWLGTVRTPDGVRVWQVGPDFLVGSWRGESGVQYVGVWEMERGE